MIDITLNNFQQDLIEASTAQPVLLDIWAPWCGPCKTLGPLLEKMEQDYGSAFTLAKLNADEVPELAGQLSQMFGVRSIPLCVLFSQGQPVDGFVGALPENEIAAFLEKHQIFPQLAPNNDEAEQIETAPLSPADMLVKLQEHLAAHPQDDAARFELIQLLLHEGHIDVARQQYDTVAVRVEQPGGDARLAALGQCITACERSLTARDIESLKTIIASTPRDLEARFELAQNYFAEGNFTPALDALLEIIMRDKNWHEGLARKTFVAILELMTPLKSNSKAGAAAPTSMIEVKANTVTTDPQIALIQQYRRQLSMMLN